MSKTLAAALVVTLASTLGFAQTTEKKAMPAKSMPAKSGMSDAVTRNETAMMEAISKKDWTAFKKMMAPGAWSIDENGPMSIDDFMKMTADPKFSLTYEYKISDAKIVDVNPTTKLITYKLEQKGSMMGQPFPPTVYASTVWVNQGGMWKAAFHQESTAAKK